MVQNIIFTISLVLFAGFIFLLFRYIIKPRMVHPEFHNKTMSAHFIKILQQRVPYYQNLNPKDREEYNKRVMHFLATKNISGVDTPINDADRLLVASSAIIPLFAFPAYNYPHVSEILLYPNSFDRDFQTHNSVAGRNILGMVGQGSLNGQVLLSKPDLERAFDGQAHQQNVGIHEFVHLIDMADGLTDGLPEILIDHAYAMAWLKEIKKDIDRIASGESNINPYALTNNAEFLAVASEYFFNDPRKLKQEEPGLYASLAKIFRQNPEHFVSTLPDANDNITKKDMAKPDKKQIKYKPYGKRTS